jgi:hypothetical protein
MGDPDIFDGIARFYRNKQCFVTDDKLFLEMSLGTHVWKAKFLTFYIFHDICIGSSWCHGHHGTLTAWLYDVIDYDY